MMLKAALYLDGSRGGAPLFCFPGVERMEEEAIKRGARNSAADKGRIANIRDHAAQIAAACDEMEPTDDGTEEAQELSPLIDHGTKASALPVDAPALSDWYAVKAVGDWELDVLGLPYGGPNAGKDAHGEYFSPATETWSDRVTPIPIYYHGFEPTGLRKQDKPPVLGQVVKSWTDAAGRWYRVVLDKASQYAARVWEAAKAGRAAASSGSIAHLMRKNQNGEITYWPVVELSIFDVSEAEHRTPANTYAVAIPAAKALYQQIGQQWPFDDRDPVDAEGVTEAAADPQPNQGEAMTPEELNAIVEGVAAKMIAAQPTPTPEAAERRLPDIPAAPYAAKFSNLWKYDNLEPGDHAFAVEMLGAAKNRGFGKGPSDDMLKSLAVKAVTGKGVGAERAASALKAAGFDATADNAAMKANELNRSTLSSYGDEWAGVMYSSNLWEKVRQGTPVVASIPTVEVPQGAESIVIPTIGASPTFYTVAQATAQAANPGYITRTVTTSKLTTGNKTLSVGKLGASVYYTGELEEDSVVPWAATLRADLEAEAMEVIESALIDGDTATAATTNINHIAGTPGGTEYYLIVDGFRKLGLVTNTANSRSASGAFVAADFINTLTLMGIAGKVGMDRTKTAFILDPWTHAKALQLAEVYTRDVFTAPTIENGQLTGIFGYRVIPTYNMHRPSTDTTYGLKANSAGKIDQGTASNNTLGAILAVRFDQWLMGWKRKVTFEMRREPSADATELVCLMRFGLTYRDNEAAAISYNVGV